MRNSYAAREKAGKKDALAGPVKKKPRIVATIEARMGSTRLPGKSLAPILGKPVLGHIVERLRNSRHINDICVATTTNKKDDAIADYAKKIGAMCFRGSEEDVLGRVLGAAEFSKADIIAEVTGDMAVVDWEEIDRGIGKYLEGGWDIVTNTRTPGYPPGIDVQVYSAKLLEAVSRETSAEDDREHVTLHIYKHPEKYRAFHLMPSPEIYDPKLRLMVDYPQDLEFMMKIYGKLYPKNPKFLTADIMALLKKEPKLRNIVKNIS